MSSEIHIAGPVAYLSGSKSAVYFSKTAAAITDMFDGTVKGTPAPVQKLLTALEVAYWGEDNRFPQNIEHQLSYCAIGKPALDWKARTLWGNGIIPGKVIDYKEDGSEIFKPLDASNKVVYQTINDRRLYRFFLEYLQDWTTFGNCFPELILSKDAKTITGFVHQESCDCRFKQMDDDGNISSLYLSKLWGLAKYQYAQFDPKKVMPFLIENPLYLYQVDNKYIKQLDVIDQYDAVASLKKIGESQFSTRSRNGLKSAILPVNYPSVNKTYYQVPAWDGARLGGWLEIACKIPSMLKTMYTKAFSIKYHIEIPETYFEDKFGHEAWNAKTETEQIEEKRLLLKQMEEFLSGDENAYKSFVSFFKVDRHQFSEYGRIKISVVEDKTNLNKEMITQSAADIQLLTAMGVHPTLFGSGTIGTGQQRSGGSDLRESYLVYLAGLHLERQVLLEPLYLMRDYNRLVGGMTEWEEDIVFRFRDTVLTTLDTGAGTAKKMG